MNKFSYMLLGAAGLMLASCSQGEMTSPVKEKNVKVTVNLPEKLGTRAATLFGTGTVSNMLNAAVYDAGTKAFIQEGEAVFANGALQTTVEFQLPEGAQYFIVFFAQSSASMGSKPVYNFDAENALVTVNYDNMNSADNLNDCYDCFYGTVETQLIGDGMYTASADLYRPVAQINWGANDLSTAAANHDDAYGSMGQYINTTLSTNAYVAFDLLAGEVTGDPEFITISNFAAPYQVTYPYTPEGMQATPYAYIAMQYLLAPQWEEGSTQGVSNLSLTISNNGEADGVTGRGDITLLIDVANAPVYANYQTNIFGTLLTEDIELDIDKNPDFYEPDYDREIGVSVTPN